MAVVNTFVGLDTVLAGVAAVGSVFTFLSFGHHAMNPNRHDIVYSFKIGLDGAGKEFTEDELVGAEGSAPNIRVFDNQGGFLGKSWHSKVYCVDGADNCMQTVKKVYKQPAYGLFTGRTDEVCVAAISVTYPSGDTYGWVGNWAHTCAQPWYYSDIDVQHESGIVKLDCAWLGRAGNVKGFSTGIRIHFPEFAQGYIGNGNTEQYYCEGNNTALNFYNHTEPFFWNGDSRILRKQKMQEYEQKDWPEREKKKPIEGDDKRSIDVDRRSIQSYGASHSAKYLCESKSSYGPSFASMNERTFCHMPDKVLYVFCEDTTSGKCWDHEANKFDVKGPGAIHARATLPDIEFQKPLVWGKK